MKVNKQQLWIEAGYRLIAEQGFTPVRIETIARSLNKNKSSFYHYFGDWEGFEEALLAYHLHLAHGFAEEAKQCQNVLPDLVHLFLNHQTDLFFHKQLRIKRANPNYQVCIEEVYQLFEAAILPPWLAFLQWEAQPRLAAKFLRLISENFLLQITPETYHFDWLSAYLEDMGHLMMDLNSP